MARILRVNPVPIILVKHGYCELNMNAELFLIETKVVFKRILNLDRPLSAASTVVEVHLARPIGQSQILDCLEGCEFLLCFSFAATTEEYS